MMSSHGDVVTRIHIYIYIRVESVSSHGDVVTRIHIYIYKSRICVYVYVYIYFVINMWVCIYIGIHM